MSQRHDYLGRAIDLPEVVDLKTAGGDWTVTAVPDLPSKLRFQHVSDPQRTPDEYDLTVVAERKEGLDPIYVACSRTNQFLRGVDDQRASLTGLGFVDGNIQIK